MHGNVLSKHMAKTKKTTKIDKTDKTNKTNKSRKAKWVYTFGDGKAEGRADMRDLLGGKGAGLAEMANLGLPVPPGFTITAKLCITYLEHGTFPDDLREEVDRHLKQLERLAKKRFGDSRNPLL